MEEKKFQDRTFGESLGLLIRKSHPSIMASSQPCISLTTVTCVEGVLSTIVGRNGRYPRIYLEAYDYSATGYAIAHLFSIVARKSLFSAMLGDCRRVSFLTGAPLPSSLKWTEADLSANLLPCFLESNACDGFNKSIADGVAPSWRSLPFDQPHLPTGLTQASRADELFEPNRFNACETSFLTTTYLSFDSADDKTYHIPHSPSSPNEEEVLTQYYEHSFAVHDEVPSSQIVGAESTVEGSFLTESDDFATSFADSDLEADQQAARFNLASGILSDLKELPNATFLRSISPQTMTVNLVVGIISISQPRIIKTRKGGRLVELVEMLVGDETRAGFGINVWLPHLQESDNMNREGDLRSSILRLRLQDIVLAKNVALSSFRGKVYGQSLRRGMTTVDLLYRNLIDGDDKRGAFRAGDLESEALTDAKVHKVERVKEWVMKFVGANTTATGTVRSKFPKVPSVSKRTLEVLPADTP